jgi:RNA ligase
MRYPFPVIKHISDVLSVIDDNFYVNNKGEYTVVNYTHVSTETFPDFAQLISNSEESKRAWCVNNAIRRECRGLIFDSESGEIIARRFHKFFNMNERRETADSQLTDKHTLNLYEKLDGSMITPMYLKSGIRWGTKNGITDVSLQVEDFVARNLRYELFVKTCKQSHLTPIFEWCSRKQKIVVDYPQDRLVLLDIRHIHSGRYADRKSLVKMARAYGIELVKEVHDPLSCIRSSSNMEGVVMQYPDGHRVKVKSDWYIQRHRAKEKITRLRDNIMLILDGKIDDLKPLLSPEDLATFLNFELEFFTHKSNLEKKILELYKEALKMSRKDFAILRNLNPQLNKIHTSIVFKLLDRQNKDSYDFDLSSFIRNLPVAPTDFKGSFCNLMEWEPTFGGTNAKQDA